MEIKRLADDFSVCKVKDLSQVDLDDEFVFIGKTDEELSVVCCTNKAPTDCIAIENLWKGCRIQGELDFSLVGILSKISTILAQEGISIFAVSTYNTDYLFIKEARFSQAMTVLEENGYLIVA